MQSRTMSFVEAVTNVIVGFVLAVLTQMLVFPAFGIVVAFHQHVSIAVIFTMLSLGRGYILASGGNDLRRLSPPRGRAHLYRGQMPGLWGWQVRLYSRNKPNDLQAMFIFWLPDWVQRVTGPLPAVSLPWEPIDTQRRFGKREPLLRLTTQRETARSSEPRARF